ncbi:unnamed protein product [Chondrus crispus]|uniref:Uncharacterized protein n=1 Tax=Chondrus crispus TaxID=2769 RepID=R7QLQ2_CHOCR|nr:unnamed protein product [Chondrus crispus]CDF38713.1 unnamed protein product [Chondrus crispus]|eukprot:XP_005718618.1 unnamed protein product [Chondrus crispus]
MGKPFPIERVRLSLGRFASWWIVFVSAWRAACHSSESDQSRWRGHGREPWKFEDLMWMWD